MFFCVKDTATTEIYTLSLHDALPISPPGRRAVARDAGGQPAPARSRVRCCRCSGVSSSRSRAEPAASASRTRSRSRSEEHTSELQSRQYLVCRLLLEKKTNTLSVTTQ